MDRCQSSGQRLSDGKKGGADRRGYTFGRCSIYMPCLFREKSFLNFSFVMFMLFIENLIFKYFFSYLSKRTATRAARFWFGITQSNISTPWFTAKTNSSGRPSPIRYLGLFSGSIGKTHSKISRIFSLGSPTATPPMAYPSQPEAGPPWAEKPMPK